MFQLTPSRSAQLRAGETLVGAMIGVGVFGLPYTFVQAGFFVGMAYLVVLGLVVMTMQMMMAEVSLQTPGKHRVAGYVQHYFGKKWGVVAALVTIAMAWGALVAYVLVGSEFVYALVGQWVGGDIFVYQIAFLMVGFFIALRGLKMVAATEMYLVAALVAALVVIIVRGLVQVDVANLVTLNTMDVFLPYGVVLFSLGGIAIVPELKDVLGRYKASMRHVVPLSTLCVVVLYALFVTAVVGVTGEATTQEAIAGLGEALGSWVLVLGSLLGFLAVSTSFLINAVAVQDLLEYDFGLTRLLAWFATLSIPTVVILAGADSFIEVMSFTGGVFGGSVGIMAAALYLHIRRRACTSPAKCFHIPLWLVWVMLVMFVAGGLIQFVSQFL